MTSSWTTEVEPPKGSKTSEDWRKSQSQENVFAMELQAHNKRNSRKSWAAGNKNKSGPSRNPGVRYHGSWQSIEDSYRQPEDGDEDDETEEEDDPGDDDGEDAATPIADQLNLLGNREYRAVTKPCRPIYSTGNCNTLPKRAGSPHCAAPPPNHPPPPPPPPSQVVRIDVDKSHSEYAAVAAAAAAGSERPTTPVMSSFRPSDNAKLYALPEDVKNVGYMTLRPQGSKKIPVSQTGSPPSSSASRSKSLPPRSSRPNVLVKTGPPKNEEPRVSVTVNSTPVIPDPDYDSEGDNHKNLAGKSSRMIVAHGTGGSEPRTKLLIEIKQQQPPPRGEVVGGSLPKSQSFCADILKAKSLLKTSQSFPEELSDCQQDSEDTYVTFVPVNGSQPESDEMQYGKSGSRRSGTLTRHAVSLIQLPPPVENGETDSDDRFGSHQSEMAVEQDSVSTISTLSSLSTSTNSSERDATILENHKPVKKINGHWREASAGAASRSDHQPTDGERTIEESLQLIRKHVDELSGMDRPIAKKSAPVVPPPPQFFEVASLAEGDDSFLAPPPPEFSDSVTHKTNLHHQHSHRTLPKSMSSGQLRGSLGDGSDDAVPVSFSSHFINRRMVERRLSDDAITKPTTVRVVGTVPKKVSFSPDVIEADTTRHHELMTATTTNRRFPHKPLQEWTLNDTADWLDSIFLNEYKSTFMQRKMDGPSLMRVNNETLLNMGVSRLGHRLNIEKSLKYYSREARN